MNDDNDLSIAEEMIRYFYTAKYIDTWREEFRNLLDCARSGSVGSDIEICKAILFYAYIDIVADKYNVVLLTTLATQKLWEVPELEMCWRSPVFVQAGRIPRYPIRNSVQLLLMSLSRTWRSA